MPETKGRTLEEIEEAFEGKRRGSVTRAAIEKGQTSHVEGEDKLEV